MKNFILIITLNIAFGSLAQTYDWAKQIGGSNYDYSFGIVSDDQSNIYVAGNFTGTLDFDPGSGVFEMTAFGNDVFLTKLDSNGNFISAIQIGGGLSFNARNITIDDSNYVYLTGEFAGTVDFDPGLGSDPLTSFPGYGGFICKLDTLLEYVWARHFESDFWAWNYSVEVDNNGNVFATGAFRDSTDFDPGVGEFYLVPQTTDSDIYICKLNSAGNFEWAKSFGGQYADYGHAVANDGAGAAYVTGSFTDSIIFDSDMDSLGLFVNGPSNTFIVKYDDQGNYIWAKQFESNTTSNYAWTIDADGQNNIVLTGITNGGTSVDFDPGPGSYPLSSSAPFFVKLDSSGDFIWAKQFLNGSAPSWGIGGVFIDEYDFIYSTGSFEGTQDFDPGTGYSALTSDGQDVFISKLTSNGDYVWAKSISGPGEDVGFGVTVNDFGTVYSSGYFEDSADFDVGVSNFYLESNGDKDIYVHRYRDMTDLATENLNSDSGIKIYPNPTNSLVHIQVMDSSLPSIIEIIDLSGRVLYSRSLESSLEVLDFSLYKSGIYILRIVHEEFSQEVRVVKQ